MMSRFHFRGTPVPPGRSPACGLGPPAPPDPLEELLKGLRGQEVSVQVEDRLIKGRLILPDPVTLVDANGKVTVIIKDAIKSIQY